MLRRFAVTCALALVCLGSLAARSNPAFASPYTLTASGVWHSNDGLFNGPWEANFDIAGYDLTGTLNMIGLPGIAEGNISGSWDLNQIGFGVMFLDQELLTFDGGLQGLEFVGSFDTGDIQGIWTGLLTSLRLSTDPITPVFNGSIPTLLLNHSSGNIGDIVTLIARLHTVGEAIDRLDSVLSFDPSKTPILSRANGRPNCSANPVVNPFGIVFEFLPQGCSGSACNQVRAVLDSLADLGPFLDGVALFTCKVKINQGIEAGIYSIVASVLNVFDPDDLLVQVNSVIGQISAKAKKGAKKFGCDCSIMGTSAPMPLASLLAPLAIMVFRRFQTRALRRRGDSREV